MAIRRTSNAEGSIFEVHGAVPRFSYNFLSKASSSCFKFDTETLSRHGVRVAAKSTFPLRLEIIGFSRYKLAAIVYISRELFC